MNDVSELGHVSVGRVKEHAEKWNRMSTEYPIEGSSGPAAVPVAPVVTNNTNGSNSSSRHANRNHQNGSMRSSSPSSGTTGRSGSTSSSTTHRSHSMRAAKSHQDVDDETDSSSSVQPLDPVKKSFMVASALCDTEGMMELLKEDAKLASFRDVNSGYTALHWAAKFGRTELIDLLLLKYNVNPNVKSQGGYTPLHLAYIFNQEEVINKLSNCKNVDTSLRDNCGKMAKHYAKSKSHNMKSNQSEKENSTHNTHKTNDNTSSKAMQDFSRITLLRKTWRKATHSLHDSGSTSAGPSG